MALARLGAAPQVIARVGADTFGEQYRSALKAEGADVGTITTVHEVPTGTALIEVEESGQNHIVIVAGANGTWTPAAAEEAVTHLTPGDLLLLQLEIPLEAVWAAVRAAAARGAAAILDPAPAPTANHPVPRDVLSALGWITPNESEAAALTQCDTSTEAGQQAAAIALVEMGVRHVVVKAGPRGAWLCTADQRTPELVPGFSVQVVDTTAAGDSFNGGLAWALAAGHPPREALRRANAVAALSTTAMGAQTGMPRGEAVDQLLNR